MSPYLWGGGHTDFGLDPIGAGVFVGMTLVCTISYEPVVGFLLNFHRYITGT